MKQKDAEYYAEQINTFTAATARSARGELKVYFDGKLSGKTRNEVEAHALFLRASKER